MIMSNDPATTPKLRGYGEGHRLYYIPTRVYRVNAFFFNAHFEGLKPGLVHVWSFYLNSFFSRAREMPCEWFPFFFFFFSLKKKSVFPLNFVPSGIQTWVALISTLNDIATTSKLRSYCEGHWLYFYMPTDST